MAKGYILEADIRQGENDFVPVAIYLTHDKEYDHIDMQINSVCVTFDIEQLSDCIDALEELYKRLGQCGNGDKNK